MQCHECHVNASAKTAPLNSHRCGTLQQHTLRKTSRVMALSLSAHLKSNFLYHLALVTASRLVSPIRELTTGSIAVRISL